MIVCCMLSNRPPLRQYLLDGEFFVGAAIACTLAKLALRYLDMEEDKEKQNVSLWLHYINFSFFCHKPTSSMYLLSDCSWFGFTRLSEQWNVAVLFHVIIHSSPFNLSVFILAGVLRKLHAHHGQYLTPWKVRVTQEGVCFRDGLRVCSPPLWPCAKKKRGAVSNVAVVFCRLLRMMMWIASPSVYVLWQSVFLSWRTSSLWSVAIPCRPCWTLTRGERKRKWARYI